MKRFLKTSAVFCIGLIVLVAGLDFALSRYNRRNEGKYLVGREVYIAQTIAGRPSPKVHTLFLGDSVARQIFPPGEEKNPSLRYLTTNQAISVAGQYYLLEDALKTHPNVKRVFMFYTPSAWANDWDQAFTHDYFCGYFHQPRQVLEAFAVKRDWSLLGTHLGRAFLPNLAALNSTLSQSRVKPRRSWVKEAKPDQPIEVSDVSKAYLEKLRNLCSSRGIAFRVYPCPVSQAFSFRDDSHLYDAPIVYLPPDAFHDDAIHLTAPNVVPVRTAMAARLSLPASETTSPGDPTAAADLARAKLLAE
jgi:hypothetical protein